jgi:hypothetical protein
MSTIAVFGVLAGGGAWAASQIGPKDIKENAVRAKHIKRNQVRTKHLNDGAVTSAKLAERKLFAHIDDDGGEDAAVAYGSGVVDVSDDPGDSGGSYIVRFSRSVEGCVVHAIPGTGVPFVFGNAIIAGAGVTPTVHVGINDGQDVRVTFVRDDAPANPDSAFMITAFC